MQEQDVLSHARACRERGDALGEEAAVNALLEREPRSVRGHVAKGDCRLRARDEAMAAYFFRRAIDLAEIAGVAAEAAAEIERARQTLNDLQRRQDIARGERLARRGLFEASWSPRFRQSLDIAAGRKGLYRQEPTAFAYPGLPNIQFYDPAAFDWAAGVEAAAPAIRAELLALLEGDAAGFRPYIRADVGSIPLEGNAALADSQDWSILDLCENGWIAPRSQERCPATWQAVLKAPVPRVSGWGPTILFSRLKAGAHIAPHTGMFNTRLICHLPLIVPPGCSFRVGNEVRVWEEGKLMIFDDTIEHEAWNCGSEDRIVLIFDIWRPELSEQERRELTALFSD